MKMKKKLGVIAALAICVTVGGVYAQWSYAEAPTGGMNGRKSIELAGVSTSTKTGVITVDTTKFSIEIDDSDGDYYGELVLEGTITVTFAPNTGASDSVMTNGIPMQATLSLSESFVDFTYDFGSGAATPVFNVSSDSLTAEATKLWEITADQIAGLFSLETQTVGDNKTVSVVYLPTYQDYTDFNTALAGCELLITVSEYVATA